MIKRSDIVFLYDAKNCVPNGDPFTGQQRYDSTQEKIEVSDVRIKRYIRDFIINNPQLGHVWVREKDSEAYERLQIKKGSGAAAQMKILKEIFKDDPVVKENKASAEYILKKCIDVRGFGGISTEENNTAHLTGPIQFNNLNYSLNKVILKVLQNTTVFVSKASNDQGSMGLTNIVPYALIGISGFINPFIAKETCLTDEDIMTLLKSMWHGVNTYRSRSKSNQNSKILLKINYVNSLTKISGLDELISIKDQLKNDYRNFTEMELVSDKLEKLVNSELVESVEYIVDEQDVYPFIKGEKFKKIDNLYFE